MMNSGAGRRNSLRSRRRWPLVAWFWVGIVIVMSAHSSCSSTLAEAATSEGGIQLSSGHSSTNQLNAYLISDASQNQYEDLMAASESLASMGIRGLCHPTSNLHAPIFPQCARLSHRNTRQLEYDSSYDGYQEDEDEAVNQTFETEKTKWFYIINGSFALLCVVGGALAAGLTVGLLSLDPLLLLIKIRAGQTPEDRQQAELLLPLVKKHHDLLVTLLLLNTVAGEALPVFLQGMVPDSVAILISVVLVLVFGEILPTALFVGPNQLQLASRLAPLVKVLMVLMRPVTYPIARLLDRIMGHADDGGCDGNEDHAGAHGSLYNRGELAALIRVQHEERLAAKQRRRHQRNVSLAETNAADFNLDISDCQIAEGVRLLKAELVHHQRTHSNIPSSDSIDNDEVMIMEGALQMKTRTAMDIHLSYHKVFCIPADMPLDDTNVFTIYASGYSRVPVFVDNDRRRVKGVLMTRQLILLKTNNNDGGDGQKQYPIVSDLNIHIPQCVPPHTNLIELVNLFQTGGSAVRAGHMALVCARPDIANAALDRDEAIPEEAGVMG